MESKTFNDYPVQEEIKKNNVVPLWDDEEKKVKKTSFEDIKTFLINDWEVIINEEITEDAIFYVKFPISYKKLRVTFDISKTQMTKGKYYFNPILDGENPKIGGVNCKLRHYNYADIGVGAGLYYTQEWDIIDGIVYEYQMSRQNNGVTPAVVAGATFFLDKESFPSDTKFSGYTSESTKLLAGTRVIILGMR